MSKIHLLENGETRTVENINAHMPPKFAVEASTLGIAPGGPVLSKVVVEVNPQLFYEFHGPARRLFAFGELAGWRLFYAGDAPYSFDILND